MSRENPWKTLSSSVIYSNPWITLREDSVIRPDGNQGIYSVVEAKLAVGVMALTSEMELYLVGQYRYPINRYSWEIIEGGAEQGESALEAGRRELREEAGLVAREWRRLAGDFHLSNCFTNEVGCIFVASDLEEVATERDATEVLEIKRLPLSSCVRMVERGEISDSLSVIGILALARERGL